jgi:hypothetical protein
MLAYQWNADGVPIPGAVATAYTPVAADVGKVLTITATGTRAGYLAGSATSSASYPVTSVATGPVDPGPDEPVELGTLATTRPTISGKAKVGMKLKAVTGSWTGGTSFTYRWLLNGKVVRGVSGRKWKLPASAKGKKVSVKVTGSKPGYATVTLTSAKTGKVKK